MLTRNITRFSNLRKLHNSANIGLRSEFKPPKYLQSADEAVALIESNSSIYCHSVAQFPLVLVKSLASRARKSDISGLVLCHLHVEGHNPFEDADLWERGQSHHFFIGKSSRKAVESGHGTYIPAFLSDIPILLSHGRVPVDYTLLNVSMPDKHGYCSLGTEVCVARDAIKSTKKAVIAQLNPNVPRTLGHSSVHMNEFNYVVDVTGNPDAKIVTKEPPKLTQADKQIGRILAEMIPDGATLQVGIGGIPNAALDALKNHKDLGIHSEMISDGVMELMQSGAVNNRLKGYLPDRTVSSFLVGSQELYDFVDDNPGIHMESVTYTNTPSIIARNSKVVAINSALEVDLTGQVCADSIGTKMISGIGGQLDFERGAALSEGGFPTICLPSKTKSGKSTIVNTLNVGAGVTTTRYHAHWIITENGAVNLWGRDLVDRARAMIGIAAPEHREELSRQAYERFKVYISPN